MTPPRPALLASVLLAAALGLAVTGYLSWVAVANGQVVGCQANSAIDCDAVLGSKWAKSFGVPVSLAAVPVYVATLLLAWPASRRPGGWAMTLLVALGVAALLAAVWMLLLQAFVLQSFCLYCVLAHACGLIVGLSVLGLATGGPQERSPDQMRSLLGVANAAPTAAAQHSQSIAPGRLALAGAAALLGVGTLATGQALEVEVVPELEEIAITQPSTQPAPPEPARGDSAEEPATAAKTESPARVAATQTSPAREFTFAGMPDPIRLSEAPILGSPDAQYAVAELIDYSCKHCRQLHAFMHKAVERYDGQLAVVVCHTPLSKECNPSVPKASRVHRNACEYAQTALGVWQYEPARFAAFHNWLMEGEKPPRPADVMQRAVRLFGDRFLLDNHRKEVANERIRQQGEVMKAINSGLPVLLWPDTATRGVPRSEEEFYQLLESKLGLHTPDAQGSR